MMSCALIAKRAAGASFQRKVASLNYNGRNLSNLCSKVCFLGGGQMCEAVLGALQMKNIQNPQNIVVCDLHEQRLDYLKQKYGISVSLDPQASVENAEMVVLAVKPQNVAHVATSINLPEGSLLLSIVAGLTVQDMKRHFHTDRIIRTMPNTPAMVMEGITVWLATPETSAEHLAMAKTFLGSFGQEMQVSEEHYVDMATAISGSGPAYVFLTMEAMIDAAVHMGFPRQMATQLVTQTIKGTAIYAQSSAGHTAKLRNDVRPFPSFIFSPNVDVYCLSIR